MRRAQQAEIVLTALVTVSVVVAAVRALADGYLPQPFYYMKSDTLMDWFNTAYWANRSGAYEIWGAVYAPLSLDFLRLFSLHGCYAGGALAARDCDWVGKAAIGGFYLVNVVLAGLAFRRAGVAAASVRTVAFALGFPMLFALERGNLVIPCLTAFILAEGGLLRGWLGRTAAFALAVNFKPYLIVSALPLAAARNWRWLAITLGACVAVYGLSFLVEGAGSPLQILRNAHAFVGKATANAWNDVYNPTSFIPLLNFVFFNPRALAPTPGWLIAATPFLTIGAMAVGLAGVMLCHAGVALGRVAAPPSRLAAMALAFILTVTGASGYTLVFLLFLVFLERWDSLGVGVAVVAAYLLSISADVIVIPHALGPMPSWLSGRMVTPVAGYAVGQLVRPVLVFAIEFGLIGATLAQWRARTAAARTPAGQVDPTAQRAGSRSLPSASDAWVGDT